MFGKILILVANWLNFVKAITVNTVLSTLFMKKRLLALSALMFASVGVFGQQDMALTHFFYNKMLFNPGATGIDEGICGSLLYRNQWDKVNGAPNSAVFNAEANLERWAPIGAGITFAHDAIGFNRTNNMQLNLSYHATTSAGILGVGVGLGFNNFGLNPNWVPPSTLLDPTLPVGSSATQFDMNAGLYWKGLSETVPYYVGLSATHLTAPSMEQASILAAGQNVTFNVARHYYFMGGVTFDAGQNGKVDVQTMVQSDLVKTSVNLNARYIYNNMFYGGLGYRTSDAISVMAGFIPFKGAAISYSYDLSIHKLSSISRGTHELMVKYCYYLPPPPRTVSNHPRWL